MSTIRKRLQLRGETLRILDPEELDHIHGGTSGQPIPGTVVSCVEWEPKVDPDDLKTPPGGFPPVVLPKPPTPPKPENNFTPTFAHFLPRPQSRAARSANGYCTGI